MRECWCMFVLQHTPTGTTGLNIQTPGHQGVGSTDQGTQKRNSTFFPRKMSLQQSGLWPAKCLVWQMTSWVYSTIRVEISFQVKSPVKENFFFLLNVQMLRLPAVPQNPLFYNLKLEQRNNDMPQWLIFLRVGCQTVMCLFHVKSSSFHFTPQDITLKHLNKK